MILFCVRKGIVPRPEVVEIKTDITNDVRNIAPDNVQFLSWNEVKCSDSESCPITKLNELQNEVIRIAQKDDVCQAINRKAFEQYGLCLFEPSNGHLNETNSVDIKGTINRTFFEWAHPMIGNIFASPKVRPQVLEEQYTANWTKFTSANMDDATKKKICELIGCNSKGKPLIPEPTCKMKDLKRSSHDQVRICPDMRTLARAVTGEVTTLATRRIEKLFALDLCTSANLYEAQKVLIRTLLTQFEKDKTKQLKKNFFKDKVKGLAFTEYIKYFFDGCADNPKVNLDEQWAFYTALVEKAVEEPQTMLPGMEYEVNYHTYITNDPIKDWLTQWDKLPPVIRCAVILNSFRRFLGLNYKTYKLVENKYSVTWDESTKCTYIPAASKDFIPNFKGGGLGLMWSWNRDENHASSITYRKHLLPLWGGPSGHAHGILDFSLSCLKNNIISVKEKEIQISAIVLSSLFPFWRLYYDKRISAIHTIAETYEASIAAAAVQINSPESMKWPSEAKDLAALTGKFTDVFDIVCACQTQDALVVNPIRLMNTLKVTYYDGLSGANPQLKFEALKKALDDKRDALAAKYEIPLWSKPLVNSPTLKTAELTTQIGQEVETDAALKLIKIFSQRNIKVYKKPAILLNARRRYIQAADSGKMISDLYERLKRQGACVTLNADSLGSAYIPGVWSRIILTDSLAIKNAVLSPLMECQFSVNGVISILSFGDLSVCGHFSVGSSGNLNIQIEAADTVKSFALKEQYTELPKTVNGLEVLSALTLHNLSSVKLTESGLFFAAEMDSSAEFWGTAKAIAPLVEMIPIHCKMTSDGKAAHFSAWAEINYKFSITDTFGVGLRSITLESGLKSADSIPPSFAFECSVGEFIATLSMNVDSDILSIHGEFDGQKVLGLKKISELFGMPGEINFLPADLPEATFGNLGILEISVQFCISPISVQNIAFTVSAEKPWKILGDKITLQPYLCFSVDSPFDTEKREIDLHIDGIWQLGSTAFCTSVAPVSGYISAYMMDGEDLDLSAAKKSFMGSLTFPDISINCMRLFADYRENSYEIFLSADKCLEFAVSSVKIGIRDVNFYLKYENRALGQFSLEGTLFLGGIAFTLQGKYESDSNWEFSASGLTDLEVNFKQLLTNFTVDIPCLGNFDSLIPDNFLSFKIGTIETAYRTSTKQFRLYVILEKIMITERFVIDSVVSEIVVGAVKLESLKIRAAFSVTGVSLLLDVSKEPDGFKISGGTAVGQTIPVGMLLDDFVCSVLGYLVKLPEPLKSFQITHIGFSYASITAGTSFDFDCATTFGGENSVLKNTFSAESHVRITAMKEKTEWKYGFNIACEMVISNGQVLTCAYIYDTTKLESQNAISLKYKAKTAADVITLADVLTKIGMDYLDDTCKFITDIGLSEAEMAYDFSLNRISGLLKLNSGGTLELSLTNGGKLNYRLVASSTVVISLSDVPIVGGLTDKFLPSKDLFSVKDLTFYALSEVDTENDIPGGVRLNYTIFNESQKWQIYEIKPDEPNRLAANSSVPKILWIKIEKTLAIFTLHRLGLGLDGSYLMLVLDASLNVPPLMFSVYGAGIGVNISNFDLKFYISGFGVAFKNEALAIAGEFRKNEKKYTGLILVQAKKIGIFAIAEYSEDGNLFAYAVLTAPLGGIPEFFITGLALGFGYNKWLDMPSVNKVQYFPLIKGAMGKIGADGMLAELDNVLHDEKGQKFLSAGIKFTTYEIIQSFVLLSVSFGNSFEIDLLGLADVTVPPLCPDNITALAHAQLALKATFKPSDGFLGIEAQLTSESYILSKACHLTGGFAFYLWYTGSCRGDFVLTLGGYHPKYAVNKPAHYPDVPAVGLNWYLDKAVTVSGGIYFALTPSTLMAGGRMSMTYELGNLKAYFTAKADFFIGWKPFHYDIDIGITLGGAYRVHLWAVSYTLSIELGVNLHIWGPDFSATAHLSFWIVSFDIFFGANASKEVADLDWDEFCSSFLPKGSGAKITACEGKAAGDRQPTPISISLGEGLSGEITLDGKKMKAVRSSGVTLAAETIMPIHTAHFNNNVVTLTPVDVTVKPMGAKAATFTSDYSVIVSDENGLCTNFNGTALTKNMPSALWGIKNFTGELVPDVPCGISLASVLPDVRIFPEKQYISLNDLYMKGTTIIRNAFDYMVPASFPSYTSKDTIPIFSATVNTDTVSKAREEFLFALGVKLTQEISLEKYAFEADLYFDEEVAIPV